MVAGCFLQRTSRTHDSSVLLNSCSTYVITTQTKCSQRMLTTGLHLFCVPSHLCYVILTPTHCIYKESMLLIPRLLCSVTPVSCYTETHCINKDCRRIFLATYVDDPWQQCSSEFFLHICDYHTQRRCSQGMLKAGFHVFCVPSHLCHVIWTPAYWHILPR